MATTTALDAVCGSCTCGGVKGCHRTEMRWGERVRTGCRHCGCPSFTEGTPPPALAAPEVLDQQHRWACRKCGARYGHPHNDHGCGPLTPVTVTITVRTLEAAR